MIAFGCVLPTSLMCACSLADDKVAGRAKLCCSGHDDLIVSSPTMVFIIIVIIKTFGTGTIFLLAVMTEISVKDNLRAG